MLGYMECIVLSVVDMLTSSGSTGACLLVSVLHDLDIEKIH